LITNESRHVPEMYQLMWISGINTSYQNYELVFPNHQWIEITEHLY